MERGLLIKGWVNGRTNWWKDEASIGTKIYIDGWIKG